MARSGDFWFERAQNGITSGLQYGLAGAALSGARGIRTYLDGGRFDLVSPAELVFPIVLRNSLREKNYEREDEPIHSRPFSSINIGEKEQLAFNNEQALN